MGVSTISSASQARSKAAQFAARLRVELVVPLVIAFVHGWLYVFVVPPWQHYDEPGHFEYAWLIANRPALPQPGDFDPVMRRDVAASMVEHGFFSEIGNPPQLAGNSAASIGIPQIDGVFGYYVLAALPLKLTSSADVALQLYFGRLASLGLLLVTVAAAWGITREVTQRGSALRLFVPLTLALIPGFVNLMSSMNNDSGATAAASLLIWGMVRVLQRGFSALRAVWVIGAAVACLFMKATTLPVVLTAPVALLLSLASGRVRAIIWGGIGLLATLALVSLVRWDDASRWIRWTESGQPTHATGIGAPLGRAALRLVSPDGKPVAQIMQLLPPDQVTAMAGSIVTLGAYMWADAPGTVSLPNLMWHGHDGAGGAPVTVGTQPAFFAFTATVPLQAQRAWVSLAGSPMPNAGAVYYDGLVLARGSHPVDQAPVFASTDAARGEWGGESFDNLIRNGSGEGRQPYLRPAASSLLAPILMSSPNIALGLALDWRADAPYFDLTRTLMFETFWARFGWGHVRLPSEFLYDALTLCTWAGVVGAVAALWRGRHTLPWSPVVLVSMAAVAVWLASITRGIDTSFGSLWIPGARYAAPVIVPVVLALVAGWREWARLILAVASRSAKPATVAVLRNSLAVAYVGAFTALGAYALISVAIFYAGVR